MDFARKQLLKYGWSEGKGLGKNESGIAQALKPTLKFDTTGVGHDCSEQFTYNWWENVYNQAADNINVENSDCGSVNVKLNTDDSVDITTRKYSYKHLKKKNINLEYGSFLKTSKLVPEGTIVDHDDKVSSDSFESMETVKVANLTDDELFAACGGRTAHKGARHGLKLNGKLARIEEQEMLLLQKMKQRASNLHVEDTKMENKYSLFTNSETQKVKHKKKKKKDLQECEVDAEEIRKHKKAKKRKPSHSDNSDDELLIEEEAARKRTEYFCAKQHKKKMECLKNREKKRLNNMTNLFENVCAVNVQQDNKDDGFVEHTNDDECDRIITKRKSKKKKRKFNKEPTTDENDDGFEECINEVSEKLLHYKELRMNLQKEKKKGDDNIISKMADELENTL